MATLLVIPCYNEAQRIRIEAIQELLQNKDLQILFVDDGSKDSTLSILNDFCRRLERIEILTLKQNSGKAEAVRQGLLKALESSTELIGYCDADFATPPKEVLRIIDECLFHHERQCVIGSRIRLLGLDVNRSFFRHILSRIFATLGSWTLQMTVYDTQCGAKFFRPSPLLKFVCTEKFISRWAFDVELLGRLKKGSAQFQGLQPKDFLEIPLKQWSEVSGSKMTLRAALRMGFDLFKIARRLHR